MAIRLKKLAPNITMMGTIRKYSSRDMPLELARNQMDKERKISIGMGVLIKNATK